MGALEVVLLDVGRDPAHRRAGDRRQGHQLRHRLRVGHADRGGAYAGPRARRTSARRSHAARLRRTRRSSASRTRAWASNAFQITAEDRSPTASTASRPRWTGSFGAPATRVPVESVGPTFGQTVATLGDLRDHRLAARHLALHRAPIRVEVRGAGAHRADARPAHHRRRLLARRPGGDDVDGRGAAHHPRLLALRHDHRVRPRARERAAHAAAPRSPRSSTARCPRSLDRSLATSLLHAAAGARAAALRRRRRSRTSPSR